MNHRPSRPRWVCEDDGEDWPCEAKRQQLLRLYHRDRYGLAARLSSIFVAMVIEDGLPLTGVEILQRTFDLIPGSTDARR